MKNVNAKALSLTIVIVGATLFAFQNCGPAPGPSGNSNTASVARETLSCDASAADGLCVTHRNIPSDAAPDVAADCGPSAIHDECPDANRSAACEYVTPGDPFVKVEVVYKNRPNLLQEVSDLHTSCTGFGATFTQYP